MKAVEEMNLKELQAAIDSFWNLPKAQFGQAQIPYLYGKDGHDFLNRCLERQKKVDGPT